MFLACQWFLAGAPASLRATRALAAPPSGSRALAGRDVRGPSRRPGCQWTPTASALSRSYLVAPGPGRQVCAKPPPACQRPRFAAVAISGHPRLKGPQMGDAPFLQPAAAVTQGRALSGPGSRADSGLRATQGARQGRDAACARAPAAGNFQVPVESLITGPGTPRRRPRQIGRGACRLVSSLTLWAWRRQADKAKLSSDATLRVALKPHKHRSPGASEPLTRRHTHNRRSTMQCVNAKTSTRQKPHRIQPKVPCELMMPWHIRSHTHTHTHVQ